MKNFKRSKTVQVAIRVINLVWGLETYGRGQIPGHYHNSSTFDFNVNILPCPAGYAKN